MSSKKAGKRGVDDARLVQSRGRTNEPRRARQGIVCTGISENISKTRFWKMIEKIRVIVQMGKVTDLRLLLWE